MKNEKEGKMMEVRKKEKDEGRGEETEDVGGGEEVEKK